MNETHKKNVDKRSIERASRRSSPVDLCRRRSRSWNIHAVPRGGESTEYSSRFEGCEQTHMAPHVTHRARPSEEPWRIDRDFERMRAFVVVVVVALTYGVGKSIGACDVANEATTRALGAALRETFATVVGDVWWFDYDQIDPNCLDCGNANPSSTYGCPRFAENARSSRDGMTTSRARASTDAVAAPRRSISPQEPVDANEARPRSPEEPRSANEAPHRTVPRFDVPNIEFAREGGVGENARGVLPMSCEWNLEQDEVILLFGCLPDEMRYFALTPYLYDILTTTNGRSTVFASMGDSFSTGYNADVGAFSRLNTNQKDDIAVGAVARPPFAPWNATFAFLMGANRDTLDEVAAALAVVAPGIGANIFRMPPPPAEAIEATYTMLFRGAVPKNKEAWRAYIAAPPIMALRLTPKTMRAANQFSPTPLIARQTQSELSLRTTFNALVRAVQTHITATGRQSITTASAAQMFASDNSAPCVSLRINCGGDNRDTNYIRAPAFQLNDNQSLVYVVGVNHAKTGNAYYSNVALYNPARLLAVTSVNDEEYARTARRWLPNVNQATADLFYVVAFARDCASVAIPSGTLCVDVPSFGFPSVAVGVDAVIWERPYATALGGAVGPWWQSLIMPSIVESIPRAPTPAPSFVSSF